MAFGIAHEGLSQFDSIKNIEEYKKEYPDEYSIYHCNACRPQPTCILKIGIKQIINSDHMNCVLQKGCGSVRNPCWRKRE
jgi:hypothetical protein